MSAARAGTTFCSWSKYISPRFSECRIAMSVEVSAMRIDRVGVLARQIEAEHLLRSEAPDASPDGAVDSPGAPLAPGDEVALEPPQADAMIANAPTRASKRFCDMLGPFRMPVAPGSVPAASGWFGHVPVVSVDRYALTRRRRSSIVVAVRGSAAVTMTSRGPQDGAYHSREASTRQLAEVPSTLSPGTASLHQPWVASAGSAGVPRSPRPVA